MKPAVVPRPEQPATPVSVSDSRWLPTRAGLLNVWQYTDEVLEFERGRLLLFGPNGSGKTMALELLLPLLLDAKAQPGRLSTSGSERGGLWERVVGYDEGTPRTGYLWLEFMRAGADAFTIGVRLRAKPSGGGDKHWFTTSQRIGIDFSLLDDHRRPLSVEQLTAAIGDSGNVWGADTAGYRAAVRHTLYPRWSEERMEALIRTLLVVRKQNVTDGLSPARLSELLTEALPPLDERELELVADGFADLDRRADHITQLEEDVAETQRLAKANESYARAVTAQVVAEVVSATTAFDNVTREVRRLSDLLAAHDAEVKELQEREATLEAEDQSLVGQLDGLKASEAYRHGAEIENLQRAAEGARQRADDAEREAAAARQRAEKRRDAARTAAVEQAQATRQLEESRQELLETARMLGATMLDGFEQPDALIGATRTWMEDRRAAIQELREHLRTLERSIARRQDRLDQRVECERQLTEAEEQLRAAKQAAEVAFTTWQTLVDEWQGYSQELKPYLGVIDDPQTAERAVAEAWNSAQAPLIEQRSRLDHQIATLAAEIEELRAEREAWLAGKDPEPEAPAGRRDRSGLPGAPFWRCVQFRESVPEDARGRIEAALFDTRLLDAWVSPDGRVAIAQGDSDLQFSIAAAGFGDAGETLAAVLEPDPASAAVPRELIARLIGSVALLEHSAHEVALPGSGLAIGRDGSWRTSRLAGRAAAGPACYIGASSRAAARRARIAELDRAIADRDAERQAREAEQQVLAGRLCRCREERESFPSTDGIVKAEQEAERRHAQMASARDQLARAVAAFTAAETEVKQHQRALNAAATTHQLPADNQKLTDLEHRLEQVRNRVSVFERRRDRAESAMRQARQAEEVAAEAECDASTRDARARAQRGEAAEAASRYEAVEKALLADYRQVMDQIRTVSARRADIQAEQKALRTRYAEAVEKRGKATIAVAQAEEKRAAAEADRARAGERFVALCRYGLPQDASLPDAPDVAALNTTTAILEAARRIRSSGLLPSLPADPAAELLRLSNEVMKRVGDASRRFSVRADLEVEETDHGWTILRARREGLRISARALLDGLREDLAAAQSELTRKQKELFEEILSGSVREHLKSRLYTAQELVDSINDLLTSVRTEAGGVRVSLKWEIDPNHADAKELEEAKKLLLRDSPVAEGRSKLDAFLRSRIERIRAAEDDTGEWRERLARMLDYREWHRFRVLVHHNRFGDKPRALDSRKVSLSAGERTIVMVLPLLAAITAHYQPRSEEPPCESPRLLLMDELFPKLDFPNKRKLMGLLPTLHLDAVFTSDKDRCEYDTLDGIAIHVCQKLDDEKTTTTRLVWNGKETRAVPVGGDGEHAPRVRGLKSIADEPVR